MRKVIFYIFTLFILIFIISYQGLCFCIKIKNVIFVSDNFVRFEDILAESSNKIASNIKKMLILDISHYPQKFTLKRNTLKKILSDNLPDKLLNSCDIPDKIQIIKGKYILNKEKLFSLLMNFVKNNSSQMGGDIRLRDVVLPEYIILGKGEKIYIQVYGNNIKAGSNTVYFITLKDKKITKKRSGRFFLDVFKPVPCAKRPLNIGEPVTPDKITFVKKNLAYLPKNIWDGKTGPYRIKVPIGALQPITMERLEPIPVVSRGQKVKLVYEGNSIILRTIGRCLEDGNIGDFIKVLNIQSHRVVYAKVVDRETVKVE